MSSQMELLFHFAPFRCQAWECGTKRRSSWDWDGRRGARHGVLPAAGPGTCWGGVRACVCLLTSMPLHQQAYTRCSGLARPLAPALQCLDVFLGAGELPRRLVFSCVCAGMVSAAPAVGAVLVCACGTGGRRCGSMCVGYLR